MKLHPYHLQHRSEIRSPILCRDNIMESTHIQKTSSPETIIYDEEINQGNLRNVAKAFGF